MIIKKQGRMNVVEAARKRIENIFSNNVPVYLSFSGGKDSLCLAHLVYTLIQEGRIDPSLLTVHFIDEEAVFPCIERTVMEWRKKFLLVGAKFHWYCLEVKHFNCLNELENDESFICWDRYKRDVWVRPMPPFAITHHPLLKPRKMTYQAFLDRSCVDGIVMIGIRVYESLQRLKNISKQKKHKRLFPIYDWKDSDVWLYLLENHIEIPDIYRYLWQSGATRNEMRVSQFFSIDTVKVLVKMNEYYPDLMERVTRREPNAYLVALYWDSEMFRRKSSHRRKLEQSQKPNVDYKKELIRLLSDIDKNFNTEHKRTVALRYRNVLLRFHSMMTEKHYKEMYEALIAGDPKLRTLRAFYYAIVNDYWRKSQ